MQIDPKLRGKMPRVDPATPFRTKDDAIRFLGGGFGSYDFYALDAATGTIAWQYQTTDDGPTAAVVSNGHVVFNTESCELEVLTVQGRAVWKRWLGDPLMSMPAVDRDHIYVAYPDSR